MNEKKTITNDNNIILHAVSYSDLCIDVLGEFAQGVKGEFVHWKASKRLIVYGDDCKSCNYIPPNTN